MHIILWTQDFMYIRSITQNFLIGQKNMFMLAAASALLVAIILMYKFYQRKMKPPEPRICPVTSPRIKLSDGRHLAYTERGVPKHVAKHKLILVHGFNSSKDVYLPLSQQVFEELGLYVVTYDRAGYGESDPNPKRSVKTEAFDIQELADHLQLGQKFYLIGVSIGTHPVWGCLKYLPHRLAGVTLLVPVINFWWPSFDSELANGVFKKQLKRDQWKLRISHYAPGLIYWWMTQKIFPFCSIMQGHPILANKRDVQTIKQMSKVPMPHDHKIRQQGDFESLYRDLIVHFGRWEFDPMEMKNPFPENEACRVYLWQGREDKLVPYELQRYLAKKLPWIEYVEVEDGGHLMIHEPGLCEAIFRQLLLAQQPSLR